MNEPQSPTPFPYTQDKGFPHTCASNNPVPFPTETAMNDNRIAYLERKLQTALERVKELEKKLNERIITEQPTSQMAEVMQRLDVEAERDDLKSKLDSLVKVVDKIKKAADKTEQVWCKCISGTYHGYGDHT